MTRFCLTAIGLTVSMILAGCQNEKTKTPPAKTPNSGQEEHNHSHDEGGDHDDHDDAKGGGGHAGEGPLMELGSTTAGSWKVSASRSEAALTPGGETVAECEVTGGSGTIAAVRCWIGTKDAKGSIKALAEIENATDPAHRHVHVEVPKPIAAGSQLWIEVEDGSGKKHLAGFDLKQK